MGEALVSTIKRGIPLLIIALVLAVLLTGCGEDKIISESKGNSTYSMSYMRFDSSREESFTLNQDKNIKITVLTNKGKLHIDIFRIKEDGTSQSYYTGSDIATGSYDLFLEEGSYKVAIKGEKHSGGFTIMY